MRYFDEERQAWIKETLEIFGFINRIHVQKKFRISTPQASKDLQQFMRRNPKLVVYNPNKKRFERLSRAEEDI